VRAKLAYGMRIGQWRPLHACGLGTQSGPPQRRRVSHRSRPGAAGAAGCSAAAAGAAAVSGAGAFSALAPEATAALAAAGAAPLAGAAATPAAAAAAPAAPRSSGWDSAAAAPAPSAAPAASSGAAVAPPSPPPVGASSSATSVTGPDPGPPPVPICSTGASLSPVLGPTRQCMAPFTSAWSTGVLIIVALPLVPGGTGIYAYSACSSAATTPEISSGQAKIEPELATTACDARLAAQRALRDGCQLPERLLNFFVEDDVVVQAGLLDAAQTDPGP